MATISDVASKAGVSISTVSNIINGTRYVSPEVTRRVLRVIQDMGYESDPIARRMKSSRSNMIGMVIASYSRVFFAPILQQCQQMAVDLGYNLVSMETDNSFELERQYVKGMCRNRFAAIILDSASRLDHNDYFQELCDLSHRGNRTAVVAIDRDLSRHGLDSVDAFHYEGAQAVVEHLIQQGCKSIFHIAGPPSSHSAARRTQGFCDKIKECKDVKSQILYGDFSPKSGYDAVKKAVTASIALPFDGIFAGNDQMAIGAIKALKEMHLNVPGQVKVAGFNDSFVTSLVEPSLTTVHLPAADMGRKAMELVLARIENFSAPPRCEKISTQLIVRKSTDPNVYIPNEFASW